MYAANNNNVASSANTNLYNKCIMGLSQLRLVEFSGFLEKRRDPEIYHKHLFVHLNTADLLNSSGNGGISGGGGGGTGSITSGATVSPGQTSTPSSSTAPSSATTVANNSNTSNNDASDSLIYDFEVRLNLLLENQLLSEIKLLFFLYILGRLFPKRRNYGNV